MEIEKEIDITVKIDLDDKDICEWIEERISYLDILMTDEGKEKMIELSIRIKDQEELTLTDKHLIYEPITLSPDDPTIRKLIDELVKTCSKTLHSPEVTVKAKMIL